jgi:glycosyltransferase involved in cell wall biosynthesis
MRFVDSSHPPGTVLLAQDHYGRFNEFEACLEALKVPTGTVLIRATSGSCAFGCNNGVRARRGDWVWFIDDDHTFEPDVLLRLLAHGKDLVAPLVPMRYPPFDLVLYRSLGITDGRFHSDYYRIDAIGKQTGLMRVEGLPKAGLLAREKVWTTLTDPWFKVGRIKPDEIDDDRLLMIELKQAGFELWADLDQDMTHLRTIALKARRDKEGALELGGLLDRFEIGIVR